MTTKENFNAYLATVSRVYYPQGDIKKMQMSTFRNEINGAMEYGAICAIQNVLNDCKDYSREEILGELQVRLLEHYRRNKKALGLKKLPCIELEHLLDAENVKK
jgi:hypothetical protein